MVFFLNLQEKNATRFVAFQPCKLSTFCDTIYKIKKDGLFL